MALSRTFDTIHAAQVSKSATVASFHQLGLYRFCLVVAVLDLLDIYGFLEFNNAAKYGYAAIVVGFMVIYFFKWGRVTPTLAPSIFLLFFAVTGSVFALRFLFYDERNSYVTAFISPLIFCAAIFIPPNSVLLDARRIVRDVTILLWFAAVLYLVEEVLKSSTPADIQLVKSMSCLLALCVSILLGWRVLGLFAAVATVIALELRPASTLVTGLICCVPIAIALRPRVRSFRPMDVMLARVVAQGSLLIVALIPLLLYFFFDDISSIIANLETSLKSDVIGGQSNMVFRLTIVKYAFATMDNFWFGNALGGTITVPLGYDLGFLWWFKESVTGEAPIHSDFVIVLRLMGIVGYVLFIGAFYSILRVRFKALMRPALSGSRIVLQSISIIACVAFLVFCSDQPYASYYSHTHLIWMLLLISEVARRNKVVPRALQNVSLA